MINKLYLQSIISKYHLKGLIEGVKWNIKNNILDIDFVSPNRDMVGKISAKNFNIPDSQLAIYSTSQLNKLISITAGDLILDLVKNQTIFTKLLISDNNYDLTYSLSEFGLIENVPQVEELKYNIKINLENENINPLIKAKDALNDSDTVCILPSKDKSKIEFCFGEDNDFSNKISYFIPISNVKFEEELNDFKIYFDSNIIKEILIANKDADIFNIDINLDGLLKIEFKDDKITNTYFLLKKISY
jgi:hypothetical protein